MLENPPTPHPNEGILFLAKLLSIWKVGSVDFTPWCWQKIQTIWKSKKASALGCMQQ